MSDVPADWLAQTFNLGRVKRVGDVPARGTMGEVWRLDTEEGAWAVKRQFAWARKDRFDVERAAVGAAVAAGLATPRIITSRDGAVEAVCDERRWRVFSWIDLGPELVLPVDAAWAARVGALLASLHRIGAEGSPGDVLPWFTGRRPAEQWVRLDAAITRAGLPIAGALSAALADVVELVDTARPLVRGRCVVSHCDLTCGNVLPHGDGLALVDWEHAGPIPPAWELGSALQHWVLGPQGFDTSSALALVTAYRDGGGYAAPLGLAAFAGAVSAWLNWTFGCVYGALKSENLERRRENLQEASRLLAAPLTRRDLQAMVDAVA